MPPGSDRNDELTVLCAQLPVLRRLNRGPVSARTREVLEQAVAAAREGRPIGGYLEALGLAPALEAAAAPETAAPETEVPGPFWEPTRDAGPTRSAGPTRVESEPLFFSGVYICPRAVCGRAEHRPPGAGLPECAIFGEALRFDGDP
jgi:hypothetical protein